MEFWINKDIQNSWIFQDAEKFKMWVDLLLMADEDGNISLCLSDLVHRWRLPKTTVHRFLENLRVKPICGTKVERLAEHLTICRIENYKGVRNACAEQERNARKEIPPSSPSLSSSFLSPTPPILSSPDIPPIIPQENKSSSSCAYTHMREEDFGLQTGIVATIEKYVEQYKSEGMWKDVALQNHIKLEQVQEIFEDFTFDQKHNATDYANYSDFKRHWLNYLRTRARAIWAEQSQAPKKVIEGADILKVYE